MSNASSKKSQKVNEPINEAVKAELAKWKAMVDSKDAEIQAIAKSNTKHMEKCCLGTHPAAAVDHLQSCHLEL